jgi:hypothetical protein
MGHVPPVLVTYILQKIACPKCLNFKLDPVTGVMVAQQTISRPPLLVAQMTEEWLNYYRKIAQVHTVVGNALIVSNPLSHSWFLIS